MTVDQGGTLQDRPGPSLAIIPLVPGPWVPWVTRQRYSRIGAELCHKHDPLGCREGTSVLLRAVPLYDPLPPPGWKVVNDDERTELSQTQERASLLPHAVPVCLCLFQPWTEEACGPYFLWRPPWEEQPLPMWTEQMVWCKGTFQLGTISYSSFWEPWLQSHFMKETQKYGAPYGSHGLTFGAGARSKHFSRTPNSICCFLVTHTLLYGSKGTFVFSKAEQAIPWDV